MTVFRKARWIGSASLIAFLAIGALGRVQAGDILPSNGAVRAGAATLGAPSQGSLTINQQSVRAVIDWGSFSIGSGNAVRINQPDATSATLNRVTGSTTSTLAGSLSANGSVFLINPNGIQITPTGSVAVTRGFVASTLDLGNDDFMAGKTDFLGSGASASVSNAGTITTAPGGYVALIGGMVDNTGLISAPLGRIGLGSGEQATLDFSGDQFLQVAIPTNATDASGKALVSNSGAIRARGGQVVLTAATARNAAREAINIPGSIQASSISSHNGAIVLDGGAGGKVSVSGRLRSTAGKITVSGRSVALANAQLSVAARTKAAGTVTVSASNDITLTGTTIDASGTTGGVVLIGGDSLGKGSLPHAQSVSMDLASVIRADGLVSGNGGRIVLWSDGATQVAGLLTAQGGQMSGDGGSVETSGASVDFTGIHVNTSAQAGTTGQWLTDPYDLTIGASDAATIAGNLATTNVLLQTTASGTTGPGTANSAGTGDITVASAISWASGNTLTLDAYHGIAITAPITVTGSGGVVLKTNDGGTGDMLSFGLGASSFGGSLTYTSAGGALTINGNAYTLVRTIAELQAINTSAVTLTGRYAMANSIADASAVSGWIPIGTDGHGTLVLGSSGFGGTFEGLGHTINALSVSNTSSQYTGLFGYATNATLENLGLTGGTVSGQNFVGALIGFAAASGSIANVFITDTVTGSYMTGGIVGYDQVTITNSHSSGTVTGTYQWTGGLAGYSDGNGSIDGSYSSSVVNGVNYVGGLVGGNRGQFTRNSSATGAVTGSSQTGGLVGYSQAAITNSHSSGTVTGSSDWTGGLVGYSESNGSIDTSYSTSIVNGSNYVGGLVGANYGQFTRNSYATGAVTGGYRVGGLISDSRAPVTNVYATGNVQSNSDEVGGLIGHNYNTVTGAYASGTVMGNSNVGGLIGVNESAVSNSDATGAVTGRYDQIGGLVGYNTNSLTTVYATGNVTGRNVVGGLAGYSNGAITSAYATGAVVYSNAYGSGGDEFGGLVGRMDGSATLSNSYYSAGTVTGLSNVGGLVGYLNPGATLLNSHYDIDSVAINGGALLTAGGLYDGQFQSWLPGKSLTVSSYFSAPDGSGFYSLSTLQNLKDFLGFAEDASLKWKLVNNLSLASMSGQVIPYFAGTFDGGSFTISNLAIAQANSTVGLFGYARGATIANLTVSGSVQGLDYVGGVVGTMYNTASATNALANVSSSVAVASVRASTQTGSGSYTGGLAGFLHGSVVTVAASGTVAAGWTYAGGLIGYSESGTITSARATGSVTGHSDQTGGLIGQSNTTIANSWSSGTVTETGGNWTGGLVGSSNASITSSWSSSIVVAGNYAGGLVGCNCGGTIDQSYATGAISGGFRIGGLIGQNQSTLTNSYATSAVTATSDEVGGLIGHNYSSVATSYATGAVIGHSNTGGFVGYNDGSIATSHSSGSVTATSGGDQVGGFAGGSNNALTTVYATGAVSGRSQVAGIVGRMDGNATLTDSYSSGAVTGTLNLGGMVGYLVPGARVTNSHYDEGTTPINAGSLWSIGGISHAQYGDWSGNGRSLTLSNYGFTPDGTGAYRIATVQDLVNFQGFAETGGLNWKLTGALDLASTPGLFTPYFAGASFDGGGFTISHLALNQTSSNLGLFGAVNNANITNITVSGSVVSAVPASWSTSGDYVGGLVGSFYSNGGNTIAGATSSVAVSGSSQIGGLIGWTNGSTSQSSASGTVAGLAGNVGGLIGYASNGTTSNASASGNVTGQSDEVGGLVGYMASGSISIANASGTVSGASYTGGLVGLAQGGSIDQSYATGIVTGNSRVGGLVGQNQDTITNSYATGGSVTGNSDGVGGFVGWDYGTIGAGQYSTRTVVGLGTFTGGFVGIEQGNGLSGVWATGNVSGNGRTGGLAGRDDRTISNSYATGNVTGTGDVTGGFVGEHNGNLITTSYATGVVNGADYTGGFVGIQYSQETQNRATGAVSGNNRVGGYVGQNQGTITTSYATGSVTATGGLIGGFVGFNYYSSVTGDFATGSVNAAGTQVGGFVGYNYFGTVSADFATGAVRGQSDEVGGFAGRLEGGAATGDFATGAVSGVNRVGGFAGWILNTSSVSNDYAMGAVTGNDQVGGFAGTLQNASFTSAFATGYVTAATSNVGGLVGSVDAITDIITNGTWNTQTTGQSAGVGPSSGIYIGAYPGVTGRTTSQLMASLPTGFDSTVWGTGPGLYPYLQALFPATPQAISGQAYTSLGTVAAGGQVGLYSAGGLLGYGTASVGADGSYYQLVAGGSLSASSKLGMSLTPVGAPSVSARIYSDQLISGTGNVVLPTITSGQNTLTTGASTVSTLGTNLSDTYGSATETAIETSLDAQPLTVYSTAAGGFTIDGPVVHSSSLQLQTAGALTIGASGSVTSSAPGDAIVLAVNGAFVNDGGASSIAAANGRWLIYSQATGSSGSAATGNSLGGLGGLSYYGDVFNFTTGTFASSPNSGNRFVYGYRPTLTVTAVRQSLGYNGTQQADSYTVAGLLNGDTQSQAIAGSATGLTATSSHAGDYSLTPGGLGSDLNYAIAYVAGTLTISKAPLTITAQSQTTTYGTPLTLDTSAATGYTISGLQSGDSASGVSESINVGGSSVAATTAHTAAGTYAISPSAVQGFTTSDYLITYATGTLTVNRLAVVINGSQSYDGTTSARAASLGVANLVTGDSVIFGGSATMAGSHVVANGTQGLTSLSGLTLSNSNYTLTGGSGSVSVTPAALTITAQSQSATYGSAQALDISAATGYTVQGLQTGDSVTGIAETITVGGATVAATAVHTAAGIYAITPAAVQGISATDYAVTYASTGALTVNRLAVILAGAQVYSGTTTAYGNNLGVTNLVSGDSVTIGGTATMANSHVVANGTQALTSLAGLTLSNGNYTITGGTGAVTVTPASLTVAARDQTATYGTPQALDGSPTGIALIGLQSGDNVTGLTETISVSGAPVTATTLHTATATYAITASALQGIAATDYTVSYAATGTLTVNRRAIVLTGSQVYDGTTTALATNLVLDNLVAGDQIAIGGTATMASSHVVAGGAEALTSLAGLTLSNDNYTLVGGAGAVRVTPAMLTIAARDQSAVYGIAQALDTSAAGYTVSGLNGNDSVTGLSESIVDGGRITSSTTALTAAATYAITPSAARGLAAADYLITYATTGLLTVTGQAMVPTPPAQPTPIPTSPPVTYRIVLPTLGMPTVSPPLVLDNKLTGWTTGPVADTQPIADSKPAAGTTSQTSCTSQNRNGTTPTDGGASGIQCSAK